MKCHYCGEELKEKQIFCTCCGTRRPQEVREEIPVKQTAPEVEFPVINPVREEFPVINPVPSFAREPERFAEMMAPSRPEPRPAYVPFGAPERKSPAIQLPTKRGLGKMFFLGILTLGIYPMVIWFRIVTELNIAASRYDGERTMCCFGAMALAPITLGIYPLVWIHGLCHRIGTELKRRVLSYEFGPSAFWLWGVLGSLILVGPFVFIHKLMKAMNMINRDFNING